MTQWRRRMVAQYIEAVGEDGKWVIVCHMENGEIVLVTHGAF